MFALIVFFLSTTTTTTSKLDASSSSIIHNNLINTAPNVNLITILLNPGTNTSIIDLAPTPGQYITAGAIINPICNCSIGSQTTKQKQSKLIGAVAAINPPELIWINDKMGDDAPVVRCGLLMMLWGTAGRSS